MKRGNFKATPKPRRNGRGVAREPSEARGQRIGVDLGGTKIEVLALDGEGREVLRRRIPTPRLPGREGEGEAGYRALLEALAGLIREAIGEVGEVRGVGIGTPGSPSPATGRMRNSNTVCLNGRPLREDLEALLGRPVRLRNDADCFALSEAQDGAAAGAASVFGVILGTGVGGGVVIGGALLAGPNAVAGEWGHNPLPWPRAEELPGPPCYCGRRGCVETWLSGPALERDHREASGEALSAAVLAARAEAGDPAAAASLDRYADRLARGLATVINLLDPEVIVLGGGLSQIAWLYEAVPARWGRYVFGDVARTRLVQARHGDSSGVRGAAWLWPA